jgi:hypothetical protein
VRPVDNRSRLSPAEPRSLVKDNNACHVARRGGEADLQFGKRGMQSPFWLADRIDALSDAAINWINSFYLAN